MVGLLGGELFSGSQALLVYPIGLSIIEFSALRSGTCLFWGFSLYGVACPHGTHFALNLRISRNKLFSLRVWL